GGSADQVDAGRFHARQRRQGALDAPGTGRTTHSFHRQAQGGGSCAGGGDYNDVRGIHGDHGEPSHHGKVKFGIRDSGRDLASPPLPVPAPTNHESPIPNHQSPIYENTGSSSRKVPASASISTWPPTGTMNCSRRWPICAPREAGMPSGRAWSSTICSRVSEPYPAPGSEGLHGRRVRPAG